MLTYSVSTTMDKTSERTETLFLILQNHFINETLLNIIKGRTPSSTFSSLLYKKGCSCRH